MSHGLKKFKTVTAKCLNNEQQQLRKIKYLDKLRLLHNPALSENPIYGHYSINKKYLPLQININT